MTHLMPDACFMPKEIEQVAYVGFDEQVVWKKELGNASGADAVPETETGQD